MKSTELRAFLQKDAASKWVNKGIYMCAPRFGKVKMSFEICNINNFNNILVLAPRQDIFEGWKNDKIKFNFWPSITYSTFRSSDKVKGDYDCYIIDEIHEASDNELDKINRLIQNKKSFGLTGSATNKTRDNIYNKTGMYSCYEYPISKAVEGGILADYEINIHTVELDNKVCYIPTKKGKITEKWRAEQLNWVISNLKEKKKPYFFMELKLMSLLQNSIAKKEKTIELLKLYKDERVLVFCGTSNIADNLGIPAYHSKSNEKDTLKKFCNGEGLHMATIKMMQSGITVLPINRGILNYASGSPEPTTQQICRFLGYEYMNPDKKAYLDILTTNTPYDKQRIKTALLFMDESKIHYL